MKKTISALMVCALVLSIALACAGCGNVPDPLNGTYSDGTITLVFDDKGNLTATCGDVTATGTYGNGTTGENLVIWMPFGDSCPEEFANLNSTLDYCLRYTEGTDDTGSYIEITGNDGTAMKFYKQGE